MKKIGIIGSGQVGQSLATGFIKHGFEVMIGSRNKANLENWQVANGDNAHIGTNEEAAKFGEIIVLAVKGDVAKKALSLTQEENLSGKTIIDATNPIDNSAPENGVIKFFTHQNESLMELLQKAFPLANFVKAFNSVGNALMVNPNFGTKPSMFICGNNTEAKKEVADILELFGWEVEDFGLVESARAIEPLCILWCIRGFQNNQWNHAFKLLKN